MDRIIRETVVHHTNHQMLSGQYRFNLYKSYKAQTTDLILNNVPHERPATKYPAQTHPLLNMSKLELLTEYLRDMLKYVNKGW